MAGRAGGVRGVPKKKASGLARNLAESTRRFSVYAIKAKEHEEYLRRQLLDATTETP